MPVGQPKYPLDASLPFNVAAQQWLAGHLPSVRPNTARCYREYVNKLVEFFGTRPLNEINNETIREYQQWRTKKAAPLRTNSEICSALQQILKHAGLWAHLHEFYKPLRVPPSRAGHSLSSEEEKRLREIALSRPKWRLAGHCMIVMLSTTMGFGELRRLRRHDVDMEKRCVTVREGAKNVYRQRTIPLNSAAFDSMMWILDRWQKLGGVGKDEYILPHHARRSESERKGKGHSRSKLGPDFNTPMCHINRAFQSIRKAAGLEHFRLYDCRVQAITKLLSNPAVSPQVSKEIAGHISQAMQDRYSIQQFDTKKAALEAIESLEQAESRAPRPDQAPVVPVQTNILMDSLIQAEIARQVAIALRVDSGHPSPTPSTPRLLVFPGKKAFA